MHSLYVLKLPNDKQYFGVTTNFKRRISQHKWEAKKGNDKALYSDIRKYGWENISKTELMVGLTKDLAHKLEIGMIANFDTISNGYNSSPGGYITSDSSISHIKNRMAAGSELHENLKNNLHSEASKKKQKEWTSSKENKALRKEVAIQMMADGRCKMPIVRKPIICNETGVIYPSILDASKQLGGRREHLRDHLHGKKYRDKFKGLTFRMVGK